MSFEGLHPALQHHVVNSLGWPELRPLQEATIDPILRGTNVLAVAPTAGGKTEAAVFPLLSRIATDDWAGLSVLYLCPLKALLNNLHPRLEALAAFVGRRAGLWHGDVGAVARDRILAEPPEILLTTPESIEAMLISASSDGREMLASVRAVVVDEIHAFGGDDRGWHLVAVLERLAELTGRPLQRIGLSATVGDPAALLDWLCGSNSEPRAVINPVSTPPAAPELSVDYVHSIDNAAQVIAGLNHGEKRLVFADARARVEEQAVALRSRDVTTFVSHSSLSLEERRRAEQAFGEARDCVIVATSTLELGIDVGDLDRVIQLGSPGSVASFLQRLGRTGRRQGTTRNMLFLGLRPEPSLATTLGMLLRWSDGYVEPISPPPEPLHLLVQQLLAVVLQDGRIGRNVWQRRLGRLPVLAEFVADGSASEVVDHLVTIGMLVDDEGMLSIGPEAERTYGFRHFLELMSLFSTSPLFLARWGQRDIGHLDPWALLQTAQPSTPVLLGGRAWDLGDIDWHRQTIAVTPSERDDGKSRWIGDPVPLSAEICAGIRRVLAGENPPGALLSERAERVLAELRADHDWARSDATTLVTRGDSKRWFTFAGLRANLTIADQLGVRRGTGRVDNLSLPVEATRDEIAAILPTLSEHAEPVLDEHTVKFEEGLPQHLLARMLRARLSDPAAVRTVKSLTLNSAQRD